EVVHHLRNAHLIPLFGAVVLATLTYPVRLIRWRLLLRDAAGGPLPAIPLWHAVAIGFMANNILPFRAGELVRLIAASRLAGARFSAVLSSVAVERIFDGLGVVTLMSVALITSDLPADVAVGGVSLRHAAQVAGALGIVALVAAGLVVAFPLAAERLVRRGLPAGRVADALVAVLEGLRQGLTVLRSPTLLAGTIVWSLALWLVNALAFYVAFQAFDIPVGFAGALLMQGILVFGITVQLTPGFVGQFEAAIVAALALYKVPNALASSYAIAFHVTTFIPIILLGAWSLARTPVALSDLRVARQP
ncbi:MAG TPA: lysylphosphatidylglycerol synthase transmembrane domain-containing protein, partial [Gemmatimonadales bacterium]|nr:lysylphosphatidylglycerol synthase transmembrane domain-containing protein [Gemmatimonadales bacterium]